MCAAADGGLFADGGVLGCLEAVVRGLAKHVAKEGHAQAQGQSHGVHEAVRERLELGHKVEDAGLKLGEESQCRGGPLVGTLEAVVVGGAAGDKRLDRGLLRTELELLAVVDLVVCEFFAY